MRIRKFVLFLLLGLFYALLYIPMVVIVAFSFNDSTFSIEWKGFTLKWYQKAFSSEAILSSLKTSLVVALFATFLSVVLGLGYVLATRKTSKSTAVATFMPNILLPDIVIAIGLLSLFSVLKLPLGYPSLIAGHTLLGLGFVVPILRSRIEELDPVLTEASMDLGANGRTTIRRVIIPLMRPAVFGSALVAFTLSLDDVMISLFSSSSEVQTLSVYVYSQMKEVVDPSINAISTLFLFVGGFAVLLLYRLGVLRDVVSE